MLSRLIDLGGDASATAAERPPPAESLTSLMRAPRTGDAAGCALRVGSYSSDRVCLQPERLQPAGGEATRSPYALLDRLATAALHASFTDEHARLVRAEWRRALSEYARPFYAERVARGYADAADTDYARWFDGWLAGVLPAHRLLSRAADGGPPALGLDATGEVVGGSTAAAAEGARAPPLPSHPLPQAEATDGRDASAVLPPRRAQKAAEQADGGAEGGGGAYGQTGDDGAGAGRASAAEHRPTPPRHEKAVPYNTPRREAREVFGKGGVYTEQGQGIDSSLDVANDTAAEHEGELTPHEEALFGHFR